MYHILPMWLIVRVFDVQKSVKYTEADRLQKATLSDNSWHYEMRGNFEIISWRCIDRFDWLLLAEHAY